MTVRLRCRKTGKTYIMEGDEPCPFCGAPIHGLDLSRLNAEVARMSKPLPPREPNE